MPLTEAEELELLELELAASQQAKPIAQPQQGDAGAPWRAGAYGLAGGQIPFGNVITSGIGAGIAKVASPLTGDTRTYGQLYEQAQADTKATQEANPKSTTAGNIIGALTTLPAAFSKAPQTAGMLATPATGLKYGTDALGKVATYSPFKGSGMLAGAGNLATKTAGSALVAAPTVGLYSAGEADAGERMDAFKSGSMLGAGIGAAVPVGLATLGAGAGLVKSASGLVPSLDDASREAASLVKKLADKHKINLRVSDLPVADKYKRLVKQGESMPFSGAEEIADNAKSQIQKAVTRVIGDEAEKITPEYLNKTRKTLGANFESFTKGKEFSLTPETFTKLDEIGNIASRKGYGEAGEELFNQYKKELESLIDDRGLIKGDRLDKLRRNLAVVARKQGNSDIGQVASDFEDAVVDIISSSDDKIAKAISDTKYKYKNYKVLTKPNVVDDATGDLNLASFRSAVRRIFGDDAYATGRAGDLGEIARVAQSMKPPSSSGTAENLMSQRGLLEHTFRLPQYGMNAMLQSYNKSPEAVQGLLAPKSQGLLSTSKKLIGKKP